MNHVANSLEVGSMKLVLCLWGVCCVEVCGAGVMKSKIDFGLADFMRGGG